MKTDIRTLGLYQPFATLMLHGKIETRWVLKGRKAPFPLGKYLIYSCKKEYTNSQLLELCYSSQVEHIDMQICDDPTENLCGFGICVGDLVEIIDPLCSDDNTFVKPEFLRESHRRIGLVFKNVQRIQPFPIKGKQGIGFLTEEQAAKIQYV